MDVFDMLFPFRLAHALHIDLPNLFAHVSEVGLGMNHGYPD
jgi:hypothetical protein